MKSLSEFLNESILNERRAVIPPEFSQEEV